MSFVRRQPTRLVLLSWVVLTTLLALTQTAFTYQDRAKQSSETVKDNKPTQTAFTYQGQLKEGSLPANGTYTFRFTLYTGQGGGHKPRVVIKDDVVVTNGSFTVKLAFGSDDFSSNESWLEVGVRPANSADPYKALSPRQQLTPTRYASLAQAEPWRLSGVPLGFSRGVDTAPVPVDKIADQSVTSQKLAHGEAVKSINLIKDPVGPAAGNNATVRPSGSTLPLESQDTNVWTKVGRTVLLATDTDNVGIGIRKPKANLDVAGTIHASEAVTVGNSVGLLSSANLNLIEVDNSQPLAIGFSNPMAVNPNPATFENIKVGIGTTNPAHNLTVFRAATPGPVIGIGSSTAWGRIAIATCSACYSAIANPDDFVLGNDGGNVRDLVLTSRSDNPSGGAIRFATGTISGNFPADTEKMRITKAGNVGIGTASPTNTLDVNGQARIRVLTPSPLLNDVVVADANGVLFTRPASTIGGGGSFWSLTGNTLTTGNELLGTMNNFPLKVFTNSIEKMRILTNGNVGIATTTPTQKLTLGSGNAFLPATNGGTDGNLYFGGITDSGQVGMRLFGGLVNTSIPGGFIDVRVNPANLSDGLRFRVDANNGGMERMRITAAGFVGIGTAAPTSRFSVGNNTFQVDSSGNLVRINNVPYSWPASPGAASTVLTNNGSGGLSWAPAAGGGVTGICSSGANFVTKWSSTSAVTCSQIFDNATNVGIGTNTPNEKLEISGNLRLPISTASVGVIKAGANRFIHNFGFHNFFAGVDAGNLTMTGGTNTAVGTNAFQNNTVGSQNSALGEGALISNTTGTTNTALGIGALRSNTGGHNNTAVGGFALPIHTSGRDNIAVGASAGNNLTTGSFNIYIGNVGGTATESDTIRIGHLTATATRTFVGGIFNTNLIGTNVVVTSSGQLGITGSSRRFKEHIEDLGATSKVLYSLRPVSFLYKPEYGGRSDLRQFGLIAEEVAKVAPELVAYDDQGKPYTVNYQFLAPMLLNEMQKKASEIEKLRARLDALEKLVEGLAKK